MPDAIPSRDAAESAHAVRLDHVSHRFGAVVAVDDVSLEVAPGVPTITSVPTPDANVGAQYTYAIIAAGTPAPVIAVTGLPASGWLALSWLKARRTFPTPVTISAGPTPYPIRSPASP